MSLLSQQNLVVSLTLAFNQFVNPWALDAIGWKYVRPVHLYSLAHYSFTLSVPSLLWMVNY